MRNVARLKMGYYPLPKAERVKLRSLLTFTGPASVIDPCVGQGAALHLVTSDAQVRRYGVELDAERARIHSQKGTPPRHSRSPISDRKITSKKDPRQVYRRFDN
jgi:hypothetical protein